MAQSTTNLGKIHVFPSEALYNQFKDIIADNDLALLKDDGAYIVAALLEQNGYVKFSNGLILQWGYTTSYNDVTVNFPVVYSTQIFCLTAFHSAPGVSTLDVYARHVMLNGFTFTVAAPDSAFTSFERAYWLSIGI